MKLIQNLIAILLIGFLFVSCRKPDSNHFQSFSEPVSAFTDIIPYDTTNVAGEFITVGTNTYRLFYAWMYNRGGAQLSGKAVIMVNSFTLPFDSVSQQYYPRDLLDSYSVNYNTNTWSITNVGPFSFEYPDTGVQPFVAWHSSDTGSVHNIIVDSITNADTLIIYEGHFQYTSRAFICHRAAKDTIDVSTIGRGSDVAVFAYRHTYRTINGFRYLFAKSYNGY